MVVDWDLHDIRCRFAFAEGFCLVYGKPESGGWNVVSVGKGICVAEYTDLSRLRSWLRFDIAECADAVLPGNTWAVVYLMLLLENNATQVKVVTADASH
jgi:hypothetical protein